MMWTIAILAFVAGCVAADINRRFRSDRAWRNLKRAIERSDDAAVTRMMERGE